MAAEKLKELLLMLKEKVENKPVRLHKKEPLALEYNEATVYSTGAIFITLLVIIAFRIGTEESYLILVMEQIVLIFY